MAGYPCCCMVDQNCVDCGPEADFSYEQTDNDPCTFNFTDESVAGTCGSIVAWLWKCEGIGFSTSQNPTGVNLESVCGVDTAYNISLTVTDETGCTDTVMGVVLCNHECLACPEFLPLVCFVTFSGYEKKTEPGVPCDLLNGTHVLSLLGEGAPTINCAYASGPIECEFHDNGLDPSILLNITATQIELTILRAGGPGGVDHYSLPRTSEDSCLGVFNLPFVSGAADLSPTRCCTLVTPADAVVQI